MTENRAAWRKSTYSGSEANCLEAASAARAIAVRDTKQAHLGPNRTILSFTPTAWEKFTASLR